MSEFVVALRWLSQTLKTDAQLQTLFGGVVRFHIDPGPEGGPYPFITAGFNSGADVDGVGPVRVMSGVAVAVKVVGQTESYVALEPIAKRVDELIHGQSGSTSGGYVVSCMRTAPIAYPEVDQGTQYLHLGGLYEIDAQVS